MTKVELRLSFQRALLFNVQSCVRFFFAEINLEGDLIIWVYVDRDLSEEDKDIYYGVAAEVTADFPDEISLANQQVIFFKDERDYEDIPKLEILLYARYED